MRAKAGPKSAIPAVNVLPPMHAFAVLYIDFLGHFPVTKRKNAYVLVMVDALSRFVRLVPTPTMESVYVLTALRAWRADFGVFQELRCDNAKSFKAGAVRELCRIMQVDQHFSTPYNHRSNGLVERQNHVVTQALRAVIAEEADVLQWDDYIYDIQLAMNSSVNATTGFPPYSSALVGPLPPHYQ